ncbi:MAG: hypothetical protein H7A37_03075 [Chlamydiales bacterium]|nr:hypothetical protein [Chlamydiia bacterium]MCP5507269.1 hypothetical protein [Chlamydiales bacterium]
MSISNYTYMHDCPKDMSIYFYRPQKNPKEIFVRIWDRRKKQVIAKLNGNSVTIPHLRTSLAGLSFDEQNTLFFNIHNEKLQISIQNTSDDVQKVAISILKDEEWLLDVCTIL